MLPTLAGHVVPPVSHDDRERLLSLARQWRDQNPEACVLAAEAAERELALLLGNTEAPTALAAVYFGSLILASLSDKRFLLAANERCPACRYNVWEYSKACTACNETIILYPIGGA